MNMSTTRRSFLATGLSAGAAVPFLKPQPTWLEAAANTAGPSDSVLVVVQIRGGWDTLQLFPELDHPIHQAARPTIKLAKSVVLPVATAAKHFWHPAAAPFKALYDRGDLAVIENIGYAKPNLSHFSSEKKWYSADPTASIVEEGWLARYLKKGYTGSFSMPAINIESRINPSFIPERVPVFRNPDLFQFLFDNNFYSKLDDKVQQQALADNAKAPRLGGSPNLLHVAGSTVDAIDDSAALQTAGTGYSPKVTYPNNRLTGYLQTIAKYITGGSNPTSALKTRIYYTSHGGFDNHGNEVVQNATSTGTFADRISEVTGSIKAFLDDMKAFGVQKKVTVMVFSEFARRLGENGSLGTDHGHGGMAFFAGEPVNGGRYGTPPDLSKATTPYNRYYIPFDSLSTDFRRMYWDALKWLGVADPKVILGSTFAPLGAVS
jgi:uncharacterized protein (DUF1501 family)